MLEQSLIFLLVKHLVMLYKIILSQETFSAFYVPMFRNYDFSGKLLYFLIQCHIITRSNEGKF